MPELEAIRKAITSILTGFSHPRTDIRPLRFLVDRKNSSGTESIDFRTLGDGFRTCLGLVMALASRMAEANPSLGADALEIPGIVMIDEIDLHLHPEWQQRIIEDFRRTFPNIQLI